MTPAQASRSHIVVAALAVGLLTAGSARQSGPTTRSAGGPAPTVNQILSVGSLSWAGIYNTYFWIDLKRGIAGVILMQYLPFADSKALAVCDAFERAVYQLPTVAAP